MLDLDLAGVHVLVTGASGGIGLATARLLLEQGAKVTAHYNATSDILQDLQHSPKLFLAQADLTSEDAVKSLFASAVEHLGTVHVVVVSHGVWIRDDVFLKDMTLERWKQTMDINLTSTFFVARQFLKGLEEAKTRGEDFDRIGQASIVFVGSNGGRIGEAMHADYSSAKSAMMYGLTLSLKNEIVKIVPRGRVNCVAPAWVYTPMAADALKDPAIVYQSLATTPLKKFGDPFDIAAQIAILASAKVSGHITGQVVYVTGGMEGRLLNVRED
ncbi:NAD dependent epimerase/dehydratase [Marasmius fiardii PR-910]|nr:NAD dependent epimerase/dehydratase [Marasmius fiardii PR-910]